MIPQDITESEKVSDLEAASGVRFWWFGASDLLWFRTELYTGTELGVAPLALNV